MLCQLGTKVFSILEDNCLVKKECSEVSYKFTRKKMYVDSILDFFCLPSKAKGSSHQTVM